MHALMASKTPKKMTMANLLPKALAMDLYVMENENMIRALGNDKFVELSIHGSQSWQHGVSAPFQHTFVSCMSPPVWIFIFLCVKLGPFSVFFLCQIGLYFSEFCVFNWFSFLYILCVQWVCIHVFKVLSNYFAFLFFRRVEFFSIYVFFLC